MSRAYYNEIDADACAWLRELIRCGHIAPGDVDERSIADVTPADLAGYDQCHFFAGIGVWSYALRQSGWPDDRPVWTGSCPCQPFSSAGKGRGFADERHLWPAFQWLIRQCRPDIVFGEQVASKDGRAWLDVVHHEMECEGYCVGACSTVACGFGAPHKRQRLYWVADAISPGELRASGCGGEGDEQADKRRWGQVQPDCDGAHGGLADSERDGRRADEQERRQEGGTADGRAGEAGGLADAERDETLQEHERPANAEARRDADVPTGCGVANADPDPGPTNGFWRDADWLFCRDGKWRPVEPGTSPLAHGAPARVGRLRGYGNAIVAPQAAAFVEAAIATLETSL